MKLSADTLVQVEEIFHAITTFPPGPEREAEALRLSRGDADLAGQALSLAAADYRREAFKRVADSEAEFTQQSSRLFGRYRTIRRIGSGGMGTVFLAERADGEYRQTVAVKVIHAYLAGEAFHKRFLEERQILAAMQHPGITKILDGGITEDGAPFLVMEYIEGVPLDVYCRQNHLGMRDRLLLFRKVCEPVAYAHRNLVVHRDVKPSNVIVTADGNPVLLDFGTAKFLENAPAAEMTAFPLLTLRYSSPEQRRRGPVTTATDVYSLGVILYELLTGTWPFGDAASPEGLLQSFGHEPSMIAPALPDDLTSILSKALAPEPEERYESVHAFSADIGNWLAGEPVQAKGAALGYRASKFVRKHWLAIAAGAVFVTGLSSATLFSLAKSRAAQEEARKAEKVSEFLNGMLSSGGNYNFDPKRYTVAQMLDSAAAQLESKNRKADPLTDAVLRTSLASSYTAVEEPEKAKRQLQAALTAFQSQGDRAGEANALFQLAGANITTDVPESLRLYRQSIAMQEAIGKKASPDLRFGSRLALADTESISLSDHAEAFKMIREALAIAAAEPSIAKALLAQAQGVYGGLLTDAGKQTEAEAMLRQALTNFGPENYRNPMRSKSIYELMTLNSRRDNFVAARDLAKEYYDLILFNVGPDHLATSEAMLVWTRLRADTGQAAESLAPSVAAMKALRLKYPPGNIGLWNDLRNLAHVQNAAGDYRGAQESAREALAVYKNGTWSPTDPRRAQTLLELAVALRGLHRVSEAQPVLQEVLAIYDKSGPMWARRGQQVRAILASK